MKALLSIFIFVFAYFFIATEKINKTIVAILGAGCVLFLKLITFEEAIAAVDFNVIFLLVGMMTAVHVLSKTGFFEWTAISVARLVKGEPMMIIASLLTVTAVLSAFLDNVTTIILVTPVTILLMQLLDVSPVPVVILEALASNIGGTATLIGDPPNILIGSKADLSFNDFLINLTPVITVILIVFLLTSHYFFRKRYQVRESLKKRIREAIPHLAIIDRKNMNRALFVLGLIFVGFFLHDALNIKPGIIALCGSMLMLILCHSESDETLMRVEWGVIFFFIGMFMMIAALEVNGVITWISSSILHVAGGNIFMVCMIILWGSAIFSAVLDNIPFVISMIPMIKHFIASFNGDPTLTQPVLHADHISAFWWALALGACLGGNGTLIGASANIVMARVSEKNNYHISFMRFFKYGFPIMLQSVLISSIYLWLRYFR